MPAQVIFASVPSGRSPGRSGYCTAARSRDLPERLVSEIERHSAHEPGLGEAYAFRILRSGADTVAVLTRFADAGPDYTGRASTLAHHLVFTAAECATLPPPADIALRFPGWRDRWDGPPAWIEETPAALSGTPAHLPAARWKSLTGDAGNAASLVDDAGNACAAAVPASAVRDALQLFAEAALLTSDKGWSATFSTRDGAHDSGSLWRCGALRASAGAATGRRAVLARSGVLPGARPEPAKKTAGIRPESAEPQAVSPVPRIHAAYIVAGLAAATIPVVLYFTLRSPSLPEPTPEAPPPVTRPVVRPSAAVDAALALAAAGDWIAFHRAAADLTAAERELAPVADGLARLRRRLIPDTVAAITARLDTATEPPTAPERAEIRRRIDTMNTLAGGLGLAPDAGDAGALRDIADALALMDRLDVFPQNALWVTPVWSVVEESPLAITRTVMLASPGPLAAFLRDAGAPMTAVISTYDGPGAKPAGATPITLTARAIDMERGKILALRHAEWGRILELRVESGSRLRLTVRAPNDADRRITDPSAPIRVDFLAADGTPAVSLILNPSPAMTPITAPARLLRRTAEGVSTPAWLDARLSARFGDSAGMLGLLPFGFESAPRDYPRRPVPVAAVAQALRTRLDKALRLGAEPASITALKARIDAVAGSPLEYGAPWTLVLAPYGAATSAPLIRFDP